MGEGGGTIPADAVDGSESEPSPHVSLLPWTFGAFHAALLVALVVTAVFLARLAGNALAALDTWIGVVAYLYLWGVSWWTNRRMLEVVGRGLVDGSASPSDVSVEAMKWGGVAGLLVFLPALLVGIALFVGAGGLQAVPFLLLGAAVGSVVSAGVGIGVGLTFALLDLLLVRFARVWLPDDGHPGSPRAGS